MFTYVEIFYTKDFRVNVSHPLIQKNKIEHSTLLSLCVIPNFSFSIHFSFLSCSFATDSV